MLPRQSLRVWILAVRTNVLVVLCCLVRIVRLFLERRPALLTNQRVTVLLILLGIVFEEGGRGRRL